MGLSKISEEASRQETADRFFHLLTDLSREVGKFREPAQKLDAFLLVVLGSLGASCGFLWARESPAGREHWIDRGIPPSEAGNWKTHFPGFIRDLQPPPPQPGGPPLFFVRLTDTPSRTWAVPQADRISLVVHWGAGRQFQGFLGLGKTIRGGDYSAEEKELLVQAKAAIVAVLAGLSFFLQEEKINSDTKEVKTHFKKIILFCFLDL